MTPLTQSPSNNTPRTVIVAGLTAAFVIDAVGAATECVASEFYSHIYESKFSTISESKKVLVDNSAANNLPWLKSFYETSHEAHTAKEILPLISGLKNLLADGNYQIANDALLEMNLKKLSPTAMVSFISATYPAKNKLEAWQVSFSKVRNALLNQGLDADSILHGLN
ncbi:hypothetical protein [Alteromonas alba]|uniref:hypothetical protein n=1 Tax=Alteromonas alba TaxID=2079529 RepID=UPI0011B298B9|nr:hypothetical protein [Alteromonas alba]